MLKHFIVALATCFTLFTTAPVALADNIVNSPDITTNSNSSQGLTLSDSASKQARKSSNKAGKEHMRGIDKVAKVGQSNTDKALSNDSVSSIASKQAYTVAGGTVSLPGMGGKKFTNIFARFKAVIDWAGQNIISATMLLVVFLIVISLVYIIIRTIGSIFGLGKTSTFKWICYFIGDLILLFIVQGLGTLIGYGSAFYDVILWIISGH